MVKGGRVVFVTRGSLSLSIGVAEAMGRALVVTESLGNRLPVTFTERVSVPGGSVPLFC